MKLKAYLGVLFLISPSLHAWQPGPSQPDATTNLSVDTQNRNDVLSFFHCIYNASENQNTTISWNGDTSNCQAGTTSSAFKGHILRRINWYRAMAGVPADLTLDASKSAGCQLAALMMSHNRDLSHNPPTSWKCYTEEGAFAAQSGNLALGFHGVPTITAYIDDQGDSNTAVGHRRWILFPGADKIGTGDIPPNGSYPSANCLIIGINRPTQVPAQVSAWPPKGFIPWQTIFERWSYSYTGSDFSTATVTMTHNGTSVPITLESRNDAGFGDNTIVWKAPSTVGPVTQDQSYTVTVSGIKGTSPSTITYDVTIIDPNQLSTQLSISGPSETTPSGGLFNFTPIPAASSYDLSISQLTPNTTVEGAEDDNSDHILDGTADGTFRTNQNPRSGSHCFHLTPPTFFQSEHFEINRNFIAQANSTLRFYYSEGFATPTTQLRCQLSQDGGASWQSLWQKNGKSDFERKYHQVELSLAEFQNQPLRFRFQTTHLSGGMNLADNPSSGFFLDDISLSDSAIEISTKLTTLDTSHTFNLDASTAGSDLILGNTYLLKVRPIIDCGTFGFSPPHPITIVGRGEGPSFNDWFASQPGLTGGMSGDPDGDGLQNGIEYVLRTDPLKITNHNVLPSLTFADSSATMIVPNTATHSGIDIKLTTSSNLQELNHITPNNNGPHHTFTTSTNGIKRAFFQLEVTTAN